MPKALLAEARKRLEVGVVSGCFLEGDADESAHNNPEFVTKPGRIHGDRCQDVLLELDGFREGFPAGLGQRDNMAAAVGVAAVPCHMPMKFEPRKGGAHGLGFDAGHLGQRGLGDGAFGREHLHRNNACMGQANRF